MHPNPSPSESYLRAQLAATCDSIQAHLKAANSTLSDLFLYVHNAHPEKILDHLVELRQHTLDLTADLRRAYNHYAVLAAYTGRDQITPPAPEAPKPQG